jgi:hypothetical protein
MPNFIERKVLRERRKQARWAHQNKSGFVGQKTFNYKDLTPHNAWKMSQKDFNAEDISYK